MNPERYRQVTELFQALAEVPVPDRAQFLDQACGSDAELRREVESLVAHEAEAETWLPLEVDAGARRAHFERLDRQLRPHPNQVGPYEILDVVAEGGMGVVYRARGPDGRDVALKLARPGIGNAASERRFEFEVSVLRRLDHPGIARLLDAGTAPTDQGERPYFAMELVSGEPLLDYAHQRPLRDQLELVARICDAVQHAHQNGVIHRDLKPSNVLVDSDGSPRVLDFGVAKAINPDFEATTRHTQTGSLLGTIQYMSPEQARGNSDEVDTRTDVYSLGVMLYEVLTGHLPYDSRSRGLYEALRVIQESEPTALTTHDGSLSGDIQTVTRKALQKERELRYQTAAALAEDLRRTLNHEPIAAMPPNSLYHLRKFAQRNRALAVGALVGLLALVTGLVVISGMYRTARSNEELAQRALYDMREAKDKEQRALAEAHAARRSEEQVRRERNRALSRAGPSRLADLRTRMDSLWPLRPVQVAAMQAWIEETERLVQNRSSVEAHVVELRRGAPRTESGAWILATPALQIEHDQTVAYLDDLSQLADPDQGGLADVRRRLTHASSIEQRSIHDHTGAWEEVADHVLLEEQYGEFTLVPQIGLVPIGIDPVSRLAEFWLLESGEQPLRDPDTDQLILTENSGIVFVLLPGRGAAKDGATRPPILLSKYELTQGQWETLTGTYPSRWRASNAPAPFAPISDLHPVEQVSWKETREILYRHGMELPTSQDLQFAARAGTETQWWTGADVASLQGAENLADRTWGDSSASRLNFDEELSDGYVFHAPVGSFLANPFGLHDLLGNVEEWCEDPPPEASQIGEDDLGLFRHMTFGGSFQTRAKVARPTRLNPTLVGRGQGNIGVRARITPRP